jgi:hypothetical protein
VRAEICARVLAGASGACVIFSVLAGFDGKRNATRRLPVLAGFRMPDDHELIPVSAAFAVIETSSCV